MARVVQTEIRRRGIVGKLFLAIFWLFNALMAVWLVSYWFTLNDMATSNTAEHTGKVIGGSIGTGLLLFVWVAGAVIFGLLAMLSRGRKTIITEDAA